MHNSAAPYKNTVQTNKQARGKQEEWWGMRNEGKETVQKPRGTRAPCTWQNTRPKKLCPNNETAGELPLESFWWKTSNSFRQVGTRRTQAELLVEDRRLWCLSLKQTKQVRWGWARLQPGDQVGERLHGNEQSGNWVSEKPECVFWTRWQGMSCAIRWVTGVWTE